MPDKAKTMPEKTDFHTVEIIKEFFATGVSLSKACEETGLDYRNVRNNLAGPAGSVKLVYAVILGKWVSLWKSQEAERRELAKQVPK